MVTVYFVNIHTHLYKDFFLQLQDPGKIFFYNVEVIHLQEVLSAAEQRRQPPRVIVNHYIRAN